jgi:hypothetical protein
MYHKIFALSDITNILINLFRFRNSVKKHWNIRTTKAEVKKHVSYTARETIHVVKMYSLKRDLRSCHERDEFGIWTEYYPSGPSSNSNEKSIFTFLREMNRLYVFSCSGGTQMVVSYY